MAGAVDPAFDSRVGGGVASGDIFADGAPGVALLGGAFAYAATVLAGCKRAALLAPYRAVFGIVWLIISNQNSRINWHN